MFFLFALFISDEHEVVLSKYSQMAILHAAHIRRVVKSYNCRNSAKLAMLQMHFGKLIFKSIPNYISFKRNQEPLMIFDNIYYAKNHRLGPSYQRFN